MKKVLVCAFVLAMSRVISVTDSRTIVVQEKGVISVVRLQGVDVRPEEEKTASEYLRRALTEAWVLVEKGDVYRSPDGLHINAAMRGRAWDGATYLGEVAPAPRPSVQRSAPSRVSHPKPKRGGKKR